MSYAAAVPIPVGNMISKLMDVQTQTTYKLKPEGEEQDINESAEKLMKEQGYTYGLIKAMGTNKSNFPLRIWIIDNSGSMKITDGSRIIATKKKENVRFSQCTRWAELKDCVNYHAQMSALLNVPTVFRLLNDPGPVVACNEFRVAENPSSAADVARDVQNASTIMNKCNPSGATPLRAHIIEIHRAVSQMAPALKEFGQRVSIILATDGLPTDENGDYNDLVLEQFIQSLRLLKGLPVWIVVRLCTDNDEVVEFYRSLDEQLELSLDVLDDFMEEAKEIYALNPWLNYALPIHRCREMGFHDRTFDMLDERALLKGELRHFCVLLFGETNMYGIADPEEDWENFLIDLQRLVDMEGNQWHPIQKAMCPWIDLKALHRIYGGSADCVIM